MNILVVTPTTSFGELIRQVLEEDERFYPALASDTKQAFKEVMENEYDLAIVDSEIDIPLLEVVKGLRNEIPAIKIILVSPDPSSPSDFPEIKPEACLGKPFYLPDFMETLENMIAGEKGAAEPPTVSRTEEVPVWLQDVDRTAQHLTRLSLETAAQAALIIRGNKMWAYAGQLSQSAADELVHKIAHYWGHDGESDLSRFIRLEKTNAEYIIYATSLGAQFVLALAFEAEVPFSKIRTQAGELARGLADIPAEEPHPEESVSLEETGPQSWNLPLGDPDDGTSSAALLAELNMPPPTPQKRWRSPKNPLKHHLKRWWRMGLPPPWWRSCRPRRQPPSPPPPPHRAGPFTPPPEPTRNPPPWRTNLTWQLPIWNPPSPPCKT